MTIIASEDRLVEFVRGQRWFGAKAQELIGAQLADHGVLRDQPRLVDALVELRYGSGTRDLYQLLVGPAGTDAVAESGTGTELARLVAAGAAVATAEGELTFEPFGEEPLGGRFTASRLVGSEQSNSSLVVDDRVIIKVYRRIEAGENPELELVRFLVQHGFENTPALHGWWSYAGSLLAGTLGIVTAYVPGAVDGWSLALDELSTDPDAFVGRARRLGEVIGEMHATFASDPDDPAFCAEEASPESLALLTATVDEDIEQVFLHLPDDDAVAPIAGRGDAVRDLLRSLATVGSVGRRIRGHGDLHLGQVLWVGSDWLVIDFEGEPARPLPERRQKRSPLRDVAGMLRSFTYAAAVAGIPDSETEHRARTEFLGGYLGEVQGLGIMPSSSAMDRLLQIYELEKAVYELRYELAHRPDWVPLPVAGIVRLLEGASP